MYREKFLTDPPVIFYDPLSNFKFHIDPLSNRIFSAFLKEI